MEKTIKRLNYLNLKLTKYAHRWGKNPSERMIKWVDEYNNLEQTENEAFLAYCRQHFYDFSHDAYDLLA